MSASRADSRQALAALLLTSVTAAQAVYDHKIGKLQGQSPVVAVMSAGSGRTRLSFRGGQSRFLLEIHTFTLDADEAQGWTEAEVEATLDLLEQQITAAMAANQRTDTWQAIDTAGESTIREVAIEGTAYIEEIIPVAVTVYG